MDTVMFSETTNIFKYYHIYNIVMDDVVVSKKVPKVLHNNIENSYSVCRNCPMQKTCPMTRDLYEKTQKRVESEFKDKLKSYNKGFSGGLQKQYNDIYATEQFEKKKHLIMKKAMTEELGEQQCVYEKDMATSTVQAITDKYDLTHYPELISLTEQLVKLRLQDLRLGLLHKEHGIAQVQETLNAKRITLTPGLQNSMEISTKISHIVKQMNEITEGVKVEVKGSISIADAMKQIIDMK